MSLIISGYSKIRGFWGVVVDVLQRKSQRCKLTYISTEVTIFDHHCTFRGTFHQRGLDISLEILHRDKVLP